MNKSEARTGERILRQYAEAASAAMTKAGLPLDALEFNAKVKPSPAELAKAAIHGEVEALNWERLAGQVTDPKLIVEYRKRAIKARGERA